MVNPTQTMRDKNGDTRRNSSVSSMNEDRSLSVFYIMY